MTAREIGGAIRATDSFRDKIRADLSTAYAEGAITRQEHEERSTAVDHARYLHDLHRLTADLPGRAERPTLGAIPRFALYVAGVVLGLTIAIGVPLALSGPGAFSAVKVIIGTLGLFGGFGITGITIALAFNDKVLDREWG